MARLEVAAWLRGLGLERYDETFRANDVDADVLPQLSDADLEKLGVSLGHRKKLLKAIAELPASEARPPGPPTALPAAADASGERRQVTVLFCDLAGYTALSRELDAEEVHALLDRFFERVDDLVERFGGTVDKHIGDCVMAVFGAPVAHGNDAERAARAALAIQDVVPALGVDLGRTIAVHIGVAAGQVIASRSGSAAHREYTVTGDSVNLASRLTDAAASGAILISDAVRGMLPPGFACSDARTLAVKGLAEPVRAWRLIGFESAAKERPPLVGRRAELAQFRGVLAACREAGTGQAVVVRGEAGIGKSRVVEEFQALAEAAGLPATSVWCSTSAPGSARTRFVPWCAAAQARDEQRSGHGPGGGGAARHALAQGEAIIPEGSVGHNPLRFDPDAIDVSLGFADWDEADRFASALADFARPEPHPWVDFFVTRGHVLAALGRGHRTDCSSVSWYEAHRHDYRSALPAVEEALASF